jgi:hypothetical protein
MTHVLNYALRKVLCGGVNSTAVAQGMCDQKGSFVDDEKLRYQHSAVQHTTTTRTPSCSTLAAVLLRLFLVQCVINCVYYVQCYRV